MATATAKQPLVPLEIRIEATAMAIREEVMNYFKGTCVERMTQHNNIRRGAMQVGRLQYQYQRIDHERENPQTVYLDVLSILTLRKLPDRLTLNEGILKASPGLKKLRGNLDDFLKNYLVAVKVETDKTVFKGKVKLDEDLFTAIPRVREDNPENSMYYPTNMNWTAVDWAVGTPQEYIVGYQTQVNEALSQLTDDMPF